MSYYVRTISDKVGWKDFLSLPAAIYKNDPNWIPQLNLEVKRVLNSAKNPYFNNASLKLYICYSDNKPVSRSIMVINRQHWEKWNKKAAFFGYFESLNDSTAVRYLFDKIETDCRSLGAEYLEGPFNPNHYSELGILIDNFEESQMFFETYNPDYYSQLLSDAGFSELFKFHTRINRHMAATIKKASGRAGSGADDKNITIRKFNIMRMNRDLEKMREINNDAFENNLYFLPLSRDEYKFSAKFLFLVTSPRLIFFAEFKGEPVGVIQCVINFNRLIKSYKGIILPWNLPALLVKKNRAKELVIFTVAIKKAFQHTEVSAMMINSVKTIFRKYPVVSTTWISDENKSVIYISELFEMKPYKHFVIYSKPV